MVQQEVVAPAGGDGHGVVRHHVVQLVGIHARGVHHHPGLHIPLGGGQPPAAVHLLNAGDLGVELEFHPVAGGVLRQGEGEPEGAHDGPGGGVQGGHRLVADIGLHFDQLIPLHNAQALHPVGHAVFIQLVQGGAVVLADHDHKASVILIGEIQLLGQRGHHPAALHVQPGHERAVGRVVPRVDDGAVGLGGAAAHILLPLQHQHVRPVAGHLPGNGAAGYPCADDGNINHASSLLL